MEGGVIMIFIYSFEFLNESFYDFVLHINRLEPELYFRNLCNIYQFVWNAHLCTDRKLKLHFMKSIIYRRKFERKVDESYAKSLSFEID